MRISQVLAPVVMSFFLLGSQAQHHVPYPDNQLKLETAAPSAPRTIIASYSGARGTDTWFYWVVSIHPIGQGVLGGPIRVRRAATLSASNRVDLEWSAVAGVTSYTILRTSGQGIISGDCSCAVATGVVGLTTTDTGAALGSFTFTGTLAATANITLDNGSQSTTRLNVNVSGNQVWSWDPEGRAYPRAFFFVDLPTPVNGSIVTCSNCIPASTPCTAGGNGTVAIGANSVWRCQ